MDFWIYEKYRGKNELILWLLQMAGGFLLFGWWMHDRWVKTCLRGVLWSYLTPIFISRVIMQKSIFEHFGILTFWAIFTVILGYFPYSKNRPKNRFFESRFFWLRVLRGQTNVPRRSFRTRLISWEHWFVPSTLSAKKNEIRKIGFLAYFYSKENSPKLQ